MSDEVDRETYKGWTIKIVYDESPSNPRTEWDNFGHMLCFHSGYNLGDEHQYSSDQYESLEELFKEIEKEKGECYMLPLRLYDHSGISISTSESYPYNDRWDSGSVGFIYVSRKEILKEYKVKKVSKTLRKTVMDNLQCEVETYNQYLTGDVYGYVVEDPVDEEVDSCYGFYGSDFKDNGLRECAEQIIDDAKPDYDKKAKTEKDLKTTLQNNNLTINNLKESWKGNLITDEQLQRYAGKIVYNEVQK